MRNRNNTRALQKEIAKKLSKSEMWVVIRTDSEGTHLHTPNEDNIACLAMFFLAHPDYLEMVNQFVNQNRNNG
jgi:3-dehydroquinate dehydratase